MATKKTKLPVPNTKKPAADSAKKASTSSTSTKRAVVKEQTAATTSSKTSSTSSNATSKLKNLKFDKRVSLPIIAVIILLVLGYLANRYLIIAWVDSKPVTKLEYFSDLSQKYGKDEREQLIVKSLIESEASKKGLTVSEDEIAAQISQIEQQQGGASQLDQILTMQNMTREDLRKLVKLQILRTKLFSSENTVTETDVNQYLEQNKASLPEIKQGDASSEAKLRENVRQQLLQDRIQATFSAWLQTTLSSNRVVRVQN